MIPGIPLDLPAESDRPKPDGKKVSLFITCMVDMLFPRSGWSSVALLERAGVEVNFPEAQTCCGQPAFNAGSRPEAKAVATQFLDAFKDAETIVTPSGSCAAMVRCEYPVLFRDDPGLSEQANRLASITWELTEFIVDGLGIDDLNLRLPEPRTYAFHDACHGLRMLGLGQAARTLLANTEQASIEQLARADECCGFGGLFSVKMADVSGAMLERKMDHIESCPAQTIACGDVSCMAHMNGGLIRRGSTKRVEHVADVLAQGIPGHGK
jgi:L-lactate dehydrogenase complex protein LldE